MTATARARVGIPGLDTVLDGGLPRDRIYLVEGDPGVGKSTLALQFLLTGVAAGERSVYITLSETEAEVRQIAESHGWSLDGLSMFELSALEQQMQIDAENTVFRPSEVELTETTRAILAFVERVQPRRVVFDSLSELRLLAQGPLRYRREVLNLKQYFTKNRATVLLLDDRTSETGDMQLQSLAHGVISLQQLPPEFGGDRRRLRVAKLRGAPFRSGYHDFEIVKGGLSVFPRLVASEHRVDFERSALSSGLTELDALLGGGIARGTSTILMGPAGTGKSSIAALYASAAAARGDKVAMFVFDEQRELLIHRADALGMEISKHVAAGTIAIRQIDPAEMSPGQLACVAQQLVENEGVKVIVIDSLNGYLQAMPAERHLYIQLHEMLTYFGQCGATTLLVMAQNGIVGTMQSPIDVSYIADSVVLLRYFEAEGRIRKAVSVIKKRVGTHENTIREIVFDGRGITVGAPLSDFRGVLTSVPEYYGNREKLDQR
jgi:circadian clock protein KaiC